MSNGQVIPTKLPASYADAPYTEIKISHHPASSPTPTPVLICTLYRPGKNNAFTDVMTDEIEHFFGLASIDDRIKCIVMTGHGKMFCAGQDLNQGFRLQSGGKNETERNHRDGFVSFLASSMSIRTDSFAVEAEHPWRYTNAQSQPSSPLTVTPLASVSQ